MIFRKGYPDLFLSLFNCLPGKTVTEQQTPGFVFRFSTKCGRLTAKESKRTILKEWVKGYVMLR